MADRSKDLTLHKEKYFKTDLLTHLSMVILRFTVPQQPKIPTNMMKRPAVRSIADDASNTSSVVPLLNTTK